MRKRIGEFLVEKGLINEAQVQEIVRHSQETGMRFGEAGMDLKLLTPEKLKAVFGKNFSVDFFHVEAKYFPKVTKDLLSVELMLKCGVLPLGYKTEYKFFRARKRINLGFLDPSRKEAIEQVEGFARAESSKVFLVLPEHFLSVMSSVYGVTEEQIREKGPGEVEPVLSLYIEKLYPSH